MDYGHTPEEGPILRHSQIDAGSGERTRRRRAKAGDRNHQGKQSRSARREQHGGRGVRDGFVLRYSTTDTDDGLPGSEGAFIACSFWLADAYAMTGQLEKARALFERLLAIRNDLGLLAEEYHPGHKRLLGNFPQAFSHVALLGTAYNLARAAKPAEQRSGQSVPAPSR